MAVLVTLVAKPGEEEPAAAILDQLSLETRATPGCICHFVHRAPERGKFVIYERYVDRAAWEADLRSEHFARLVLDRAMALLESSDRMELVPLEPNAAAEVSS